eukprot:2001044-Rhodomonas_salina.2
MVLSSHGKALVCLIEVDTNSGGCTNPKGVVCGGGVVCTSGTVGVGPPGSPGGMAKHSSADDV